VRRGCGLQQLNDGSVLVPGGIQQWRQTPAVLRMDVGLTLDELLDDDLATFSIAHESDSDVQPSCVS
jgi:hypothetical protein